MLTGREVAPCTRVIGIVLGFLLLTTALVASAAVPQKISYQGRLTDTSGNPLAGDHNVMFVIYDDATAGVVMWSETQTVTADTDGVFSAILGSVTPLDCSFEEPTWLEVYVDGMGLAPRRPIVSVASALYAARAAGAGNADSLGHAPAGSYSQAVHTHSSLAAPDGSPDQAVYVEVDGKVGINTTAPGYQLSVVADPTGSGCRAVHGAVLNTSAEPDAYGVVGETWSSSSTLPGAGVYGVGMNTAGRSNGVVGITGAEEGAGVFGWADHTSGANYGVKGLTSSPSGYAGYFQGGQNYFSGRVGIGTDIPMRLLHVYNGPSGATAHSSSDLLLESDIGTTIGFLSPGTSSQGLRFSDNNETNAGWILYDHSNDRLQFGTGNVEQVCITDNHRMGIGTLNPNSNLHIHQDLNDFVGVTIDNLNTSSSSSEGVLFGNEDGEVAGLRVYDDNSTYSSAMTIYNNRPGGNIRLATGGFDRMHINNAGKVGIGVASPAEQLDVAGTIKVATTSGPPLKLSSSAGSYIEFATPTASPMGLRLENANGVWFLINGPAEGDRFCIYNPDAPAAYREALVIDGSMAKVGIGTNAPTSRLDVFNSLGYNQVRMRTSYTPTSTTDTNGDVGDIAWDSNYVYIKTPAGWKRAALSTWGL